MYEDILLPFDGSDGAAEALHHAAEIAHWADATIHVLFVADTTRDSVTVVETQVVDALVQEGKDIVEEAEKTLNTLGVDYDSDVVQGHPAPTIVEYAEQYEYDVIVMPTHGREGVSRYLIGSVTEKVIHLSSVPVLTARMQPDEQLVFPYENILIPTDGSAGAAHTASMASHLQRRSMRLFTCCLSSTIRRWVWTFASRFRDMNVNRLRPTPWTTSCPRRRHAAYRTRSGTSNTDPPYRANTRDHRLERYPRRRDGDDRETRERSNPSRECRREDRPLCISSSHHGWTQGVAVLGDGPWLSNSCACVTTGS